MDKGSVEICVAANPGAAKTLYGELYFAQWREKIEIMPKGKEKDAEWARWALDYGAFLGCS